MQSAPMRSDYNQHSELQSRSLQQFKPFIDGAVAAHLLQDLPNGGTFTIADFGCSTGLNSSDAMSYIIRELRKKYSGKEDVASVLVVLNDQSTNDWRELMRFVHEDERSFLHHRQGAFATCSGRTFYEQVLPNNSLQLGISSLCLHWCSRLPTKISNHCISLLATDAERELFKKQSAEDWSNFLKARSKELVKGGVLALNFVACSTGSNECYNVLYDSVKALLDKGIIEVEELEQFNIATYFRSLEDVNNTAEYEALGLELLKAEKLPPTPYAQYEEFLNDGDVERFATGIIGMLSAGLDPTFLSALSSHRSDSDKAAICTELWREYRARIVQQPREFMTKGCHLSTICLVIRKC